MTANNNKQTIKNTISLFVDAYLLNSASKQSNACSLLTSIASLSYSMQKRVKERGAKISRVLIEITWIPIG